jgi:uncharacterized protein
MRRVSMWALVGVVLAFDTVACKRAQEPPPSPPPAVEPTAALTPTPTQPFPRPMFWSIAKDGKTSYALGTMHTGVDAEARLPKVVWQKLEAASSFAMEMDMNDPSVVSKLMCTGCSLRRDLGPELHAKLEAALDPMTVKAIDSMKPLVAIVALTTRSLKNTTAMDAVLRDRAAARGKPIEFLETAADQIAALEKWTDLRALKAVLADLEAGETIMRKMFEAYIAGDDEKMLALTSEERALALKHGYTPAEYKAQTEDILYGRNAAWIARIEKLHAAGGTFVAVGALHLIGERSVLDLLAKKGYTVGRVTP